MCDEAVDTYPSTIKFVPECFMTQEMCDKAVNRWFFVFDFIPDWCKTQEMCDRVVSEDPSLIVYCPDKYITQRMCDEAVDDCLAALKLIHHWFVSVKMIKKLYTVLYADENILYFNKDSGNIVFSCNEMGILNIDLNDINLDNNFDEDILILYFLPDFWFGILNLINPKRLKEDKWRTNANSKASLKILKFLYVRR